jgi:hypothetical protein
MPSVSIDNCAGVSDTTPSFACGQTNRPRSNRLAQSTSPWPSQNRIFSAEPDAAAYFQAQVAFAKV